MVSHADNDTSSLEADADVSAPVSEDSDSPAETSATDAPDASRSEPTAAAEPDGPPRSRRLIMASIWMVAMLAADLVSKAWAWNNLREGPPVTVIDKWVYFEFGFNTGSAFSLLRDASWARTAFILVTFLALIYMVRLATTLPTRYGSAFFAVAMVSAGALGNLHDRFLRLMEIGGEMRYGVVDFIKVYYWPGKVWPTFNVADVALVLGVGVLLVFLTRHGDALDPQPGPVR